MYVRRLAAEQPTGAEGPQRRLLGLCLVFPPVGRSSGPAFGIRSARLWSYDHGIYLSYTLGSRLRGHDRRRFNMPRVPVG